MKPTTGKASSTAAEFLDASRGFLRNDFLPRMKQCISVLKEEDIWWRPNEASNSIGNLMLHLEGNMRQWILEGLGGIPSRRDRDSEFSERSPIPKAALLARLEQTVTEVDGILETFDGGQLLAQRRIQVYDVSSLQAIYHVVEHFSYHLGQVLYICKLRTGRDMEFYRELENK